MEGREFVWSILEWWLLCSVVFRLPSSEEESFRLLLSMFMLELTYLWVELPLSSSSPCYCILGSTPTSLIIVRSSLSASINIFIYNFFILLRKLSTTSFIHFHLILAASTRQKDKAILVNGLFSNRLGIAGETTISTLEKRLRAIQHCQMALIIVLYCDGICSLQIPHSLSLQCEQSFRVGHTSHSGKNIFLRSSYLAVISTTAICH